jgi:hypothetical protein
MEYKILRELAKRIKLRRVIHEVYSQRKNLNKDSPIYPLPLGKYESRILSLSRNGFEILDIEHPNRPDSIEHLPFTNRHYLISSYHPSKHLAISLPKVKELCDIIPDLDPDRITIHFNNGIKYHQKK